MILNYEYYIEYNKGYCKMCDNKYTDITNKWCKPCQINDLKANFTSWSKNEKIDSFIQEKQLSITHYDDIVFKWIPFNQFNNIEEIKRNEFAILYSAIWKNNDEKVVLKCVYNSKNMISKFLNEV